MRPFYIFLVSCLCIFQSSAQNADHFVLKGRILHADAPFIYLLKDVNGKTIKDSCKLRDGNFYFEGNIKEPTWVILKTNSKTIPDDENPNIKDLFIEPGTVSVMAEYNHFKEMEISGSKSQSEYEALNKKYDAIDQNSDSLAAQFSGVSRKFIVDYPGSYISAFTLALYRNRWAIDSVRTLYSKLTPEVQNSSFGKEIIKIINDIDNNSAGKEAKEFTSTDINGKTIRLSDFKGKYVLLDFWGSWCVPIEIFKK